MTAVFISGPSVRAAGTLAFFLLAALLFHLPPVVAGQWPVEDDTKVFFFPLMVAIHNALSAGQFPLWTPLIFSGYPLFADGEGGALYPLNLLVLPWLAPEAALVLLAVVHSSLAGFFTYALLRALGAGPVGGLLSGLVYAYCGFAVGQMVHMDVTRAMIWLPLELMLAERSVQSAGASRYRWSVLTGAVFGIQALALHIQVTLLSGLVVGALLLWSAVADVGGSLKARPFFPVGEGLVRWRRPSSLERGHTAGDEPPPYRNEGMHVTAKSRGIASVAAALADVVLGIGLIGLIGVGLGAVQLFPLAELAGLNYRALGLPPRLAEVNTVWPGSLATLLLPRLFDIDSRDFWGPWVKWETVVYVGIVPLVLALVGIGMRGGRHRVLFGLLAAASLLAAMGGQSPIPVWGLLHEVPFVRGLESPGRFSLLFSLSMAVLAGYGADGLWRRRPSRILAAGVLGAGAALVAGAGIALFAVSERLQAFAASGTALAEAYLHLAGVPTSVDGALLTPARLTGLAADALSPSNTTTAEQLGLATGAALAIALALGGGRLRLAAPVLLIGLTYADLWQTGLAFHPWAPIGELRPSPPAVLASGDGLYRVLTLPTLGAKDGPTDPNRLLVASIAEAGGYSSLEPDRHLSYLSTVMQADDDLLDLWNARYIVRRHAGSALANYRQVAFNPDEAIFLGKQGGSSRELLFMPDRQPGAANTLAFVAELREAQDLLDGEEVAQVRIQGADGDEQSLVLRAGDDVSDARADQPNEPPAKHRRGEVADDRTWKDPDGSQHRQSLFFRQKPLTEPITIARVSIRQTARAGRLLIYGLTALDGASGAATQLRERSDRPAVYADDRIVVNANSSALPRAFLVGESVVVGSANGALARMHEGPFDPRRQVVLEASEVAENFVSALTLPPLPNPPPRGGREYPLPNPPPHPPEGGLILPLQVGGREYSAQIDQYGDEEVVIRANAAQPGFLVLTDLFYPGWVAWVDGNPAPVLRADYLFRAVSVPAGEHTIVFSYEPMSVALGGVVTLVTGGLVLVFLLVLLVLRFAGSSPPAGRGILGEQPT